MILLLENDSLTAGSIRGVLRGSVETIATSVEIRRRLESQTPHTIVVGPTAPEGAALELARAVRVSHPSVGVIVIRPRIDTSTLTAIMRAGARDAIAAHELDKLAERVAASEATWRAIRGDESAEGESGPRAHVVTVFSPKGGAGKTTLATNLACALAASDRRVALLDFDLAFGDVAIAMGLQAQHHIGEAIELSERIDPTAFRSMLTRHASGVEVLAAPTDPADVEKVPSKLLERLIDVAAAEFDVVVIDTAPVLDERNLAVLERADKVLMVTTLDVAAIKNVKVSIETLRLLSFPMDAVEVVLNRADAKVGLDPNQVPGLLHARIAAHVPSSRAVPEATNHGVVLAHEKPRHPVSAAVYELAAVEADLAPAVLDIRTPEGTRRGMFRFRRSA